MDHEVTATDAVGEHQPEHLSADTIIARANSEHARVKAELMSALDDKRVLDEKIKRLRTDEKKWGRIVRGARGRGTPKEPTAMVGTPAPPEPIDPADLAEPLESMQTAANDDGTPKAMGDYFPSVDD